MVLFTYYGPCDPKFVVSKIRKFYKNCSQFYFSWPLSEATLVAQGHLPIDFTYILILKVLQSFRNLAELIFELSRSQEKFTDDNREIAKNISLH